MKYEWNEEKYRINLQKHGIRFEDTFEVFADPNAIEIADDLEHEERFIRIGLNPFRGIIVVIFCEHLCKKGHKIRSEHV